MRDSWVVYLLAIFCNIWPLSGLYGVYMVTFGEIICCLVMSGGIGCQYRMNNLSKYESFAENLEAFWSVYYKTHVYLVLSQNHLTQD